MSLVVDVREVSVSYPMRGSRPWRRRQVEVLHDLSFRIERGDRVGLVGRNGAGKSTLLRVVADLIRPDKGVVQRKFHTCQLLSLSLGFIPYLTGRQNAVMSGLLQGLTKAQVEQRLEVIQAFSGLDAFFDEELRTYSTGMQARLGFAVAMQLRPQLLLIDEVLSVGDHDFQEISKRALRERVTSGISVMLVSHSSDAIADLCDRALWIEGGKLVAEGPVDAVLRSYEEGTPP